MEAPQKIVYILPFQWLHEICLLKRLPLHFWPGLIPLATITLPIHSARRSRVPTILYIKTNMVSVCLSVVTNRARQGRAARADIRPQQVIFSYAWKSNSGGVYLYGQCLEDSSSHCPFPVELPQM
jgi:hypothetical protein